VVQRARAVFAADGAPAAVGLDADGLLSRHLLPLLERIHELLGPGGETDAKALMKRVKIISALRRPVPPECFERMGEALMRRRACTCAT